MIELPSLPTTPTEAPRSMVVPYAVIRANNLPMDALAAITCSDTIERLAGEAAALRNRLTAMRDEVCAALYERATADGDRYRALIDLKRRIYKGTDSAEIIGRHDALIAGLAEMAAWRAAALKLRDVDAAIDLHFDAALAEARRHAQRLAGAPSFVHALAFTRGAITASAREYARAERFDDKRALNDEETIYRYLTRAIAKVSPFSTFTSVGFVRLQHAAASRVVRGSVTANVYSIDRSTLLKLYERFVLRYRHCWRYRLTANRVDDDGAQFVYLFTNRLDIYPYRTGFAKTAIAERARALYDALSVDWLPWSGIEALLPPTVDAGAMLEKWLNTGMLSFSPRLDEQAADVLSTFRSIASGVLATLTGDRGQADDGTAARVVATLERIEAAVQSLDAATVDSLPATIAAINADLNALAEVLDFKLIKTTGLVYNDSHLADLGTLGSDDANRYASQIGEFIQGYIGSNFRNALHRDALAALRAAVPVDRPMHVFAFHEAVQRCLQAGAASNERPTDAQAALIELFDSVWRRRHEDEIVLEPRPMPAGRRRQTFSAFGHVLGKQFVLNNLDSGFLRCFSRFFTFTDDRSILKDCRAAYGSALDEAHDFYDTFGFNTACRPRICRGRVWLDTTEALADGDVTVGQLDIVWPAHQPYPGLRRRDTGAAVQLRHTSLFIPELYPKLLETLIRFAAIDDPCYFAFRFGLFKRLVDANEPGPVCIPRVRYRDIVLSRRQWWFRRQDLVQRLPGEAGLAYFRRIDAWRRAQGLPQRVFVRRHQLDKVLERDISNQKKPLFLDFSAPIMSRMIGRVFNTPFDYLSAEEMLPDHAHDFVTDGRHRYASEIILEQTSGFIEGQSP